MVHTSIPTILFHSQKLLPWSELRYKNKFFFDFMFSTTLPKIYGKSWVDPKQNCFCSLFPRRLYIRDSKERAAKRNVNVREVAQKKWPSNVAFSSVKWRKKAAKNKNISFKVESEKKEEKKLSPEIYIEKNQRALNQGVICMCSATTRHQIFVTLIWKTCTCNIVGK